MAFFNYVGMQVSAKIVYYGPGLCGKTTNLQHIYQKTSPKSRGEMVSLETETDRTLFFDLLPIEVGMINGFKVKFQLYTVPGQVFYNETRKMVLKGVDGIVFVADSQPLMMDSNTEAYRNLLENLETIGVRYDTLPVVFQYNKRDLENALPVAALNEALNPEGKFPFFESSARDGRGVFETLRGISGQTLETLRRRLAEESERSSKAAQITRTPPSAAPAVVGAPVPPAAHPAAPAPLTPQAKRTSRELDELLALVAGKKKGPGDAPAPPPRLAPPAAPAPAAAAAAAAQPAHAPYQLDLVLHKTQPGQLKKVRITVVTDDGERVEKFENALSVDADGSQPIAVQIKFTR
jgi:signal recognition particle receptor subunit beta